MTASHTHIELTRVTVARAGRELRRGAELLVRLLRLVTSRRVVMGLMMATIAAISLQLLVPQHRNALPGEYAAWNARYGEVSNVLVLAGVDRVTSTPWFRTIVLLMSAAMTLSGILRGWRLISTGPAVHGPVRYRQCLPATTDMATMAERLRQSRFRVLVLGSTISAHRGALASWGSIAFHLGIVVIVAGSVVTSLTAFTGYVELAPGQALISGDEAARGADYIVSNSRSEPELAVRLDKVEVERWPNGEAKQVRALVTVLGSDDTERIRTVTRNGPIHIAGADFTLGSPMGTAVRFTYIDQSGGATSGYVNLPESRTDAVPSVVRVPGTEFDLTVRHAPESEPIDNVRVEYTDDAGAVGSLLPGHAVSVDGGELVFEAVETWAMFMVSKDPGFSVMVAGGIVVVAGLALALFISPATVTARRDAGVVVVEQRSRRFVPNLISSAFEPRDGQKAGAP